MKLQSALSFLVAASSFGAVFSQGTIVEVAVNDGRFTTLVSALTSADLVEALSGDGPFTVFAPVDDAFAGVPPKFLEPMYSEHLKNILLYHVVGGANVMSTDLTLNLEAETLNTESITVTSLDPVQINGVDVIIPDVDATNGVVHVVDEVLLPAAATKSVVDLALATPELSTLVDLLTAADLVDTLSGDGPFTVFAPTNEAFAKLPAETVASLTDPANVQDLIDILTFHVVMDDIILSTGLGDSEQVAVKSASMSSPPAIDASIVSKADILANNGVVHVIDTVLIPEATAPEDEEDDASAASSLAFFAMVPSALVAAAMMM